MGLQRLLRRSAVVVTQALLVLLCARHYAVGFKLELGRWKDLNSEVKVQSPLQAWPPFSL